MKSRGGEQMKKMAAILAGAALMVSASSAMALPINNNRPLTPNVPATGELSLQTILDNNFNLSINAVTGQSTQAIWQTADGGATAYAVAFMKGDAGNFGVYSYTTGQKVVLMANPAGRGTTTFGIDAEGSLVSGNNTLATNFGTSFGFFWQDTTKTSMSFTEDSKNPLGSGWGSGSDIKALTYLVKEGTQLTGTLSSYFSSQTAKGNDDWVMAFEDRDRNAGGDGDFQDAVFYVKDLQPVPEPGTMMLLGAGFLGLAIYGKRRRNA